MKQLLTLTLLLAAARAPAAEAPVDTLDPPPDMLGAGYYVEYCAVCHGSDASGQGPLAPGLTIAPPDLRVLARLNGGIFPLERVRDTIDGRDLPLQHGVREMPVWGQVFNRSRGAQGERRAQERIDALIEYLTTLQQR